MDLIRISDTKLKIMLTSSDMQYYDLHNDHISITDQHVRSVLRQLLSDAKEKTGFDGDMTRLYVQMFPSRDGGCELFVSKPESYENIDINHANLPALTSVGQKGRAMSPSERYGQNMCVYSFTRLEHLISVCKRLVSIGFCGKSSAYVDYKKNYYLFLTDIPLHALYAPDEFCFLGEYGQRENVRSLQTYLGEYAKMICKDNAVQTLIQL